jgi:hypothetical protein
MDASLNTKDAEIRKLHEALKEAKDYIRVLEEKIRKFEKPDD